MDLREVRHVPSWSWRSPPTTRTVDQIEPLIPLIWRTHDLNGVNEMVARRQAGSVGGINDGTPDGGEGIILRQHASL